MRFLKKMRGLVFPAFLCMGLVLFLSAGSLHAVAANIVDSIQSSLLKVSVRTVTGYTDLPCNITDEPEGKKYSYQFDLDGEDYTMRGTLEDGTVTVEGGAQESAEFNLYGIKVTKEGESVFNYKGSGTLSFNTRNTSGNIIGCGDDEGPAIFSAGALSFTGNGRLYVDGIRSDNTITVEDGVIICNGELDAKDGVFLNGGTVLAYGGDIQEESMQKSAILNFNEEISGTIVITDTNGTAIFSVKLPAPTKTMVISLPEFAQMSEFCLYSGCEVEGLQSLTGAYASITEFTGTQMGPVQGADAVFTLSDQTVTDFENISEYAGKLEISDISFTAPYGYEDGLSEEVVITNPWDLEVKEVILDTAELTLQEGENGYFITVPGGKSVGTYTGTLTVSYEDKNGEVFETDANVVFIVSKVENIWTTELSMNDFTQYESDAEPVAEAAFGNVVFSYSSEENGAYTETFPDTPGKYYVKASVKETENYTGLESGPVSFTMKEHVDHLFEESIEGDCETQLIKEKHCKLCGIVLKEDITPGSHSYDSGHIETKETCTKDGTVVYTCSVCHQTKTEAIPATGVHEYASEITKTETCTETGTHTYKCSMCGLTYTETIPATGHQYDNGRVTREATCENPGERTFTCEKCGTAYTEEISALGHQYDSGKITKEATCTAAGIRTYTCQNDSSHTYTEEIPATGHVYDDGKVTKNATCDEKGVKTFTCKSCGNTYTEEIAAHGHSWGNGKITKEATCEEEGVTTYTCRYDSSHTRTEAIPKLEHNWGKGVVTKKATCGQDGVMTYTCTAGGETKTETIPATGEHTWGDPMLTNDGKINLYVCTVCGETKQEDAVTGVAVDEDDSDSSSEETGDMSMTSNEADTQNAAETTATSEKSTSGRLRTTVIILYAAVAVGGAGVVYFIYRRQKKGY